MSADGRGRSYLNRRVKGWPGWVLMIFVIVGLLAVGVTRASAPRTPDERIQAISERIACPVCSGESVADSQNPASEGIRERIKIEVRQGVLTDDEIINGITSVRDGKELLVPTASGIESLAWALPATAFVLGVVGLAFAFRRWRTNSASIGHATVADYALVAKQLDDERSAEGAQPQAAAPSAIDSAKDSAIDSAEDSATVSATGSATVSATGAAATSAPSPATRSTIVDENDDG